jgi:Cu-processing system permease protein
MKTNIILSIAKKEIMDNIRNKWIILVSVMFAILTLVISYFGSLGGHGWQDLGVTISGMESLVTFLVPIIALMLGYATVIGEIERGSMNSLLSLATNRFEIIVGKFLGLSGVLCFTILVGFGVGGLVIAANVADVNYLDYLVFLGATMLLGLVFLSIALFFSSVFNKRSSALGMAIFLWFFFNIILSIVFFGLLAMSVDITQLVSGGAIVAPDWYHALNLCNPVSVYSSLITIAIGPVSSMEASSLIPAPSWYSSGLLIGVLLIWIVVFFFLALWRFQRKDV